MALSISSISQPKIFKIDASFTVGLAAPRGIAGRSFPGRQEVVALDKYWVAYKELPMALDSMINSPMVLST